MASLDKSSVRNEVSHLKADFEQLCAEGKIPSKSKVLMNSMFMIVELILSIFLERSTQKKAIIPAYRLRKVKRGLKNTHLVYEMKLSFFNPCETSSYK